MNIKKGLFNLAWLAAIALCVLLSVIALIFASCSPLESGKKDSSSAPGSQTSTEQPGSVQTPPSTEPQQPPAQETPNVPQPSSVVLAQTANAGREYLDKIVFLGDSTTYGIGYYYDLGYTELCPPSQIWTPSSGTLTLSYYSVATVVYPETGEEIPIIDAVTRAQPEIMLLTLGVNGVSFMDEEWFITDYTALINNIKTASPDTRIILNSIYPVAKSYPSIESISNEKIVAANGWIQRIAEATGCKYLNTYEVLVGADGALPEGSHNGDGIHLSGETFEIVMEYIRTHAYN